MIYLSGHHSDRVAVAAMLHPIGLMIQPKSGYHRHVGRYRDWAADNGCFAQGDAFKPEAWIRWLRAIGHHETCRFAVAPDVMRDPVATWRRSEPWLGVIRSLGYPAALVAQDGIEGTTIPWPAFDALFIGGSTLWKLSDAASRVAAETRRRGKWLHMGRVNSMRRLRAAAFMGCDSVDGTYLVFRARKRAEGDRPIEERGVPELVGWLQRLQTEPFLPLAEAA